VELVSKMIGIGIVLHGPELRLAPVYGAIGRLAGLLKADQGQDLTRTYQLVVVFEVPGSLGGPTFTGARKRDIDHDGRHLGVEVAVPESVTRSAAPDPDIVRLARDAVAVAEAFARDEGAEFDPDAHLALLAAAEREVMQGGPAGPRPLTDAEAEDDRILAEAMKTLGISAHAGGPSPVPPDQPRAVMTVTLSVPDESAVAAAWAFEEALHAQLERTDAGYIEGNDVGSSEFNIYVAGDSREALEGVLHEVLATKWDRPGARVR